ncbi:MAG: glycosyltransferase [Actinomycetes bacterium]
MTGPATVLWVTKGLGRGGAEQLLVTLAGALDRQSVELHVAYVLPHKDALAPQLAAAGVTLHCIGHGVSGGFWWPVRLAQLISRLSPDVVHTHAPLPGAVARVVARRRALVHTEHNVWARYRLPTRWANAVTLRRNRVVFAVSQGVAASIRPGRLTGALPPVEVMLHGIDPALSAHGPEARAHARRRLELSSEAFVVGTVANFTPKKDQDTLLRAIALLRRDVPSVELVLVGGGPREAHLKTLARELGIDRITHFAGVRDDVPQILPAFDAFGLSSRHEGLSIALLEAMASHVPAVATAVGGVPEVIHHEADGLLVPAGDPRALADGLRTIADDDRLRERLASAARLSAETFGIEPAAARLTACYAELAGLRLEGSVA